MTIFPASFNLLVYISSSLFLPPNFKNDPIICSHFQDQFPILLKPSKIQMFQKQKIEREKGLHLAISFLLKIYPASFLNNRCQTYSLPLSKCGLSTLCLHYPLSFNDLCCWRSPFSKGLKKSLQNELLPQKLGFG